MRSHLDRRGHGGRAVIVNRLRMPVDRGGELLDRARMMLERGGLRRSRRHCRGRNRRGRRLRRGGDGRSGMGDRRRRRGRVAVGGHGRGRAIANHFLLERGEPQLHGAKGASHLGHHPAPGERAQAKAADRDDHVACSHCWIEIHCCSFVFTIARTADFFFRPQRKNSHSLFRGARPPGHRRSGRRAARLVRASPASHS